MVSTCLVGTSHTDDHVDQTIEECLNPSSPQSFFLFAGAGAGKTHSLVNVLENFKDKHGEAFHRAGKKIAVITYTNAAADEITSRLERHSLFHVSTIHSFCWLQIQGFHDGIREYLRQQIPSELEKLEREELKGRAGTKASIARKISIEKLNERLIWLKKRREFTYNPNGDNIGQASLSHAQVISICAHFLLNKPSFQQLVVNRHPFMLIDESQDTNKSFIEALFEVERNQSNFCLGLIGDVMQRIYADGKADLGREKFDNWAYPVKEMNRRSPSRIISLANDIRQDSDGQEQRVLDGKPDGEVRLFIAPSNVHDKPSFEASVKKQMAEITSDDQWLVPAEVKHLMLEHKMAAVRMGFELIFETLGSHRRFDTALRSGDLPITKLFSESVMPLYQLYQEGKHHAVMSHLRKVKSPLLDPAFLLEQNGSHPLQPLRDAVDELIFLIDSNPEVSFQDVLQNVARNKLFLIPQIFHPFIEGMDVAEDVSEEESGSSESAIDAILRFLKSPYHQIAAYKSYVAGEASFDTHQGVKGREFERVQVVMDDRDAGGFLFSYEKLFEVKPPSATDIKNSVEGRETGVDRTRRLFYVTCTRAEKSLALVAYTENPDLLKSNVLAKGWFKEDEILMYS